MVPLRPSSLGSPLRLLAQVLVGAAILWLLTGCRSNNIVLDQRPAWVVEAEQRLKKKPVSSVEQNEGRGPRPLWQSQPASGSGQPGESSIAGKRRQPPRESTISAAAPQPEGVSWGETKITVEVAD